jgi:branched-chain amino acid transport system ATP-binding protein
VTAEPRSSSGASSGAALSVERLEVAYGNVTAVWDVSFDVGEGEIVALAGANGAGKTTTLKAISGLVRPRGGAIRLGGEDVARRPATEIVARGVVHVPEGRKLFPDMSVRDNLLLGGYHRAARPRQRERLGRVMETFPHLRSRADQLAGTLSGGEQQMVAIGRGLMAGPRVLMLDEPSLGLAPVMVEEMFRVIEEIHRQGVTVLLVEQNTEHALAIADRAFVLESGRTVLAGTGRELLQHPRVREAYLGI